VVVQSPSPNSPNRAEPLPDRRIMSTSTADDPHSRGPGTSASPPPPLPNPNPSDSPKSTSKASPTLSTSALPPPDQAQIDSHLSAVRRRSIAHVAHVPHVLGRPETGTVLGGVEPQEGDEQDMRTYGEEADELLRSATVEMEAFRNAMREGITMIRGDQEVRFDERGQEAGLEEEENRQEYVWDGEFACVPLSTIIRWRWRSRSRSRVTEAVADWSSAVRESTRVRLEATV
jgi:hypothetical protein